MPNRKKDRVGERHETVNWGYVEIIEYNGCYDCTIRFEDGEIKHNVIYSSIKTGQVAKDLDRTGEIFNINGEVSTIIYYNRFDDVGVMFEDGTIRNNVRYSDLKKGVVKNLYKPLVAGVGFVGEGKYSSEFNESSFIKWHSMLVRGNSKKFKENQSAYKDISICEEWKCFQNFAEWFEERYNPDVMQSWQLDKDILIKGNKTYSPNACCLVPKEINRLITRKRERKNNLPRGVSIRGKKYQATLGIGVDKFYLGVFDTVEEAFQAYKTAKEARIKEVADKWKPLIAPETYQALINYKIEITD